MFGGKASADQRKGPHAPSPSQGSNSTRRSNDTLRARLRRTTRQDNARRQGSPNGSCHRIRAQHGGRGERSSLRVRGNTDNGGLGLRTSTPSFSPNFAEICLGEVRRIPLPRTRVNRGAGGPRRSPRQRSYEGTTHQPVYTEVRTHAPRGVSGYGIRRGFAAC
jgi:hypothetical protein